jgi:hypothetical protein
MVLLILAGEWGQCLTCVEGSCSSLLLELVQSREVYSVQHFKAYSAAPSSAGKNNFHHLNDAWADGEEGDPVKRFCFYLFFLACITV